MEKKRRHQEVYCPFCGQDFIPDLSLSRAEAGSEREVDTCSICSATAPVVPYDALFAVDRKACERCRQELEECRACGRHALQPFSGLGWVSQKRRGAHEDS